MQKHQQSKEVQEAYEARGEEYVALGVHATLFDIETLTTLNVLLLMMMIMPREIIHISFLELMCKKRVLIS